MENGELRFFFKTKTGKTCSRALPVFTRLFYDNRLVSERSRTASLFG